MEKYVEDYRFHYLYKIINLVNGKYYFGIHSTNNIDDGYMGSGVRLHQAYRKYGIENFKKEILGFYETRKSLLEAEAKIVTVFEIQDDKCYNIALGGKGQFCFPSKEERSLMNKKAWQTRKQNENWKDAFIGYNNPEFVGKCKEKYEYNKDKIIAWCTKTNVPDAIIEKMFVKNVHQNAVISYYIQAGLLPQPKNCSKIKYEGQYRLKTVFTDCELTKVLFLNGAETSKRINRLPEIVKYIKDDICTISAVQNNKKYNFTMSDVNFFTGIGVLSYDGDVNINTGCKNSPLGKRILLSFTPEKKTTHIVDLEMTEYEFNNNGELVQKSWFQL